MSTPSEFDSPAAELDLDLHFLPAWAQRPASENKYTKFEGEEAREARGGRAGRGEGRRRPPQGDRPGRPPAGRGARPPRGPHPGRGRREMPRREPAPPPVEVDVHFVPEEKGVESLARQIRLTGRAYPLFDIGFLILKKPERYHVQFSVIKKADDQPAQRLYLCSLDDTLWLSEADAVAHVLANHFSTFYETEKIPSDPPKGVYTFVAQCGISGTILGPPNYHDYQNKLRKLHAERFAHMPFEVYKARVKIVKEPEVVKKWLEDQSWKTEYITLNVPEPVKFARFEEVEQHFRETHAANIVREVESHIVSGQAAQDLPSRPLRSAVRRHWDQQMRFPLRLVTVLSQQFAEHGLQFFKVNKTVTHVAVARPRYLDMEATPVSDGVRRIVEFIANNPNTTRRKLLEALAPSPEPAAVEGQDSGATAPGQEEKPPSPEVAAVVSDLHWLIHQGHVTEYANGIMELARRQAPRPPKPEPKKVKDEPAREERPSDASAGVSERPPAPAVQEPAENAPAPDISVEVTPGQVLDASPGPDSPDRSQASGEQPPTASPASAAPGAEPSEASSPPGEVDPSLGVQEVESGRDWTSTETSASLEQADRGDKDEGEIPSADLDSPEATAYRSEENESHRP